MKCIVDAQLPSKLCEILTQIGLDAIHVDALPKGDESSDLEIAEYADERELFVITKDIDFYHGHMALKRPNKLFLITTGNIKNKNLFDLIRNNALIIKNLLSTCNFIELTNDGIIGHE